MSTDGEPESSAALPVSDPRADVPADSPKEGADTLAPGAMNVDSEIAAALPPPGRHEVMVAIRIAVRPDLPGPIRGVCVDLDVHRGLGDILSVSLQIPISEQLCQHCDSAIKYILH